MEQSSGNSCGFLRFAAVATGIADAMIVNVKNLLKLITLLFGIGLIVEVQAQTGVWLGADRGTWKQTDYRKTKNDFGASLLITPDRNWKQKWETSPETVVRFDEANSVRIGENLTILPFFRQSQDRSQE